MIVEQAPGGGSWIKWQLCIMRASTSRALHAWACSLARQQAYFDRIRSRSHIPSVHLAPCLCAASDVSCFDAMHLGDTLSGTMHRPRGCVAPYQSWHRGHSPAKDRLRADRGGTGSTSIARSEPGRCAAAHPHLLLPSDCDSRGRCRYGLRAYQPDKHNPQRT